MRWRDARAPQADLRKQRRRRAAPSDRARLRQPRARRAPASGCRRAPAAASASSCGSPKRCHHAPLGGASFGAALAPRRLDLPGDRHVERRLAVVGAGRARASSSATTPSANPASRVTARLGTDGLAPALCRWPRRCRPASAAAGATATLSPSASESGGLSTIWSFALTPSSTSTFSPKLRPTLIGRSCTRALRIDDRDAHALAAEQQRVGRDRERLARRQRQRDLHVGAGQQHAVAVGQRDLDLHRARRGVDRGRGARDLAAKRLAAQLGLRDDDLLAGLHELRVGLRHVDVDAQRIGLREHEQRAAGAAAGVDQVADVDVAPRDHAGERRDDALEAFELAQPLDVGVGRGEVRARLREAAAALVELLLRDRVLLAQRLPSARSCSSRARGSRRPAGARRPPATAAGRSRASRSRRAARPSRRGCRCPCASASGSRSRAPRSAPARSPAACRAARASGRARSPSAIASSRTASRCSRRAGLEQRARSTSGS